MRSLVLIISLLFAFASTQGQGAMFLRGSQEVPPPGAGLLDSYPGAAAAFSLDALIYSSHSVTDNTPGSETQGQTGPYTIQARRSSDNALRSFTPTEVSDGTLTTWTGPLNDATVAIWYNQGSAGDAVQAAPANQPRIVENGALIKINTRAAIQSFTLSQGLVTSSFAVNSTNLISAVVETIGAPFGAYHGILSHGTVQIYSVGTFFQLFQSSNTTSTSTIAGQSLISLETTSNNATFYKNTTPGANRTLSFSTGILGINFFSNTFAYNGKNAVVVVYNLPFDRNGIETALNTYYQIY